jgi:serine/threonine protein kinase
MADHPPSGSTPAAAAASMIGEVIHNYRITKKLGEGGMGEVYAAEHIHIAKRIAIKLLRPEIVSNKEAVERFYQEARSASSIGHKNIIAIDDFGKLPDGRIYMFMELLGGAPLNDMIKTPLSVDRLLNILIQTGHGLAAAHAKGITHRDMKPENIFVTQNERNEDIPKLLDFGIAKVAGNDGQNNLTKTGTIFGTPFYMAPEQALGQQVDARADVYAMGVIMYEVFSGSLPFQGESFMGILTQHITTEPEPVLQRAAQAGRVLPPGLAEVIGHCLQKDPQRRYPTMDALVQALVEVYRGIAGSGMSSYMEAFAAPRTGAHTPQSGAGTGPYPPHASLPTVVHGHGTGQMPGQSSSYPPPPGGSSSYPPAYPPPPGTPGSGPVAQASSGSSGLYAAGNSGLVEVERKKSKAGLIFALIAVLAAAGGIIAFVVLDKKKKSDAADGPGTGSAVASNEPSGSAEGPSGSAEGPSGSAGGVVTGTPDAAPVATGTPDAAPVAGGTPDASQVAGGTPDAATAPPPKTKVSVLVDAKNVSNFEVWRDGKKIGTRATVVEVEAGTEVRIVLKAKGYEDTPVVLDGSQAKVEAKLKSKGGGDGGKVDCRQTLKQPNNPECKKQFCDDTSHMANPACLE